MRKALVVAAREYNAAVRTKTFLIGLLVMPILMGGSIVVQYLLRDVGEGKPRPIAVVDRTAGERVYPELDAKMKVLDKLFTGLRASDVRSVTRYHLQRAEPGSADPAEIVRQRFELSERVRKGELFGFLEIGPNVFEPPTKAAADVLAGKDAAAALDRHAVRFQSNRMAADAFGRIAAATVNEIVQETRANAAGLSPQKRAEVQQQVPIVSRGLTRLNTRTGQLEDAPEQSRLAAFIVPLGLMMLSFAVLMMTATPLMQGVVEEKMQRIAEVLLGSVPPFQLMLGKLIGMTGVSLTIAAVYLGGAYWLAWYYGFSEFVTPEMLGWFVLFQALSTVMFGALFIAVGAACSDLKETQNLLWPVMMLAVTPMFLFNVIIQEPNSAVATGASFVPFATPILMLTRQAVPPGIPTWQPVAGAVLVLATTVACVWVAGRIFRVGLLVQGKGAGYGQMLRWVFRG